MICTLTAASLGSCIDDAVSTRPSDQPVFAADTLHLGEIYSLEPSPTHRMTIHNPYDKSLIISEVRFENDNTPFRMNLDGAAGNRFENIEIRSHDSIYVFVEGTFGEPADDLTHLITDRIMFTTNGVTRALTVAAEVRNATRLRGLNVTRDTTLGAERPIVVFDSLTVAPGVTLTLEPGVQMRFHDGAWLGVAGTLVSRGTPQLPVDMTGDRRGMVAAQIPYDIMSGQWEGVYFAPESTGNVLTYTTIRNTKGGVAVDSLATLSLTGCVLRNSMSYPLAAVHARIDATACEIAEGADGLVYLRGGEHKFDHCTLANNYLFSVIGGPAIQMNHLTDDTDDGSGMPRLSGRFTNCIIGGLGTEMWPSDLTGADILLERCVLKSTGENDEQFVDCLWDTDPLFLTVRSEYLFDYRIYSDSPAAGAALQRPGEPALTDPAGEPLNPHIGAYAPVTATSDQSGR